MVKLYSQTTNQVSKSKTRSRICSKSMWEQFRTSSPFLWSYHTIQIQTPIVIKRVPNNAYKTRVSSPKSIAETAVAANVVALVTGTAREMGLLLKIAKKVAEADRFSKKGMEYCQINSRLSQFLNEASSRWCIVEAWGWWVTEDLSLLSQIRAPRRMIAFVAPHTRPIAIIFSTSLPIFVLCRLSVSGSAEMINQRRQMLFCWQLPVSPP